MMNQLSIEELQRRLSELEQENRRLKAGFIPPGTPGEALKGSEEKFKAIFNHASDGMILVDLETRKFLMCNAACAQMLGYTQEEFPNLDIAAIHPGEDLPFIYEQIGKFARGEKGMSRDIRFKRKDGSIFFADLNPARLSLAEKSYLLLIFRDITERKQAEEALRQSEERFRVLFGQAADIILLLEIGPEGIPVIRDVNRAAFRLLGYERDELIGQPVSFLEAVPDASKVVGERRENILSGSETKFEAKHRCKDGTIRDFECSVTEMLIGSKTFAISVERDITERKRAEEAVRASENRYRFLFDFAPIGIGTATQDGKVLDLNKGMVEVLGYSIEELRESGIGPLYVRPEDREALIEALRKSGEITNREVTMRKKDGTVITALMTLHLVERDGQKVIFTILRDITDSKRAEEAVRESEGKYRALVETTDTGYVIIDSAGRVLDANREYIRLTGRQALEEILGRRVTEWTAQHDLARNAEEVGKCMERGFVHNLEIDYVNGEGKFTPIEVNATVIQMAEGARIVTLCRDITERKRIELSLQESEQRFRTIFDNSNDGILLADIGEKSFFTGNKTICQMLGYTLDEIKDLGVMDIHPREHLPYIIEQFERQARKEIDIAKELPVKRKDGGIFYADVSAFPITLVGKTYLVGTFRDVTERKQAEAERERLILELQGALTKVRTLSGLLPICASCKKVRDDKGYWNQIEVYIRDHTDVDFSHSICPDCARKLYPEIYEKMMREKGRRS